MTAVQTPQAAPPGKKAERGHRSIYSIPAVWSRIPWSGKLGLITITLMMLLALGAPWIAPYDPNKIDLVNRLSGPSAEHWLGVDHFGRDVLSRLLYGGRTGAVHRCNNGRNNDYGGHSYRRGQRPNWWFFR